MPSDDGPRAGICRAGDILRRAGWCPEIQARSRGMHVIREIPDAGSMGRGTGSAGVPVTRHRYRNRILFWAIFYSLFFLFAVPLDLGRNIGYLPVFLSGIASATGLFALSAPRLWRNFDRALRNSLAEDRREGRRVLLLVFSLLATSFSVQALVMPGLIPGLDIVMVPLFMIGFSVIPWLVLTLIIVWEGKTGHCLYYDANSLSISPGY